MIDGENTDPSWGQEIRWTHRNGNVTISSTKGHPTEELAKAQAIENAKHFGWTPPKWWEYWRWDDTDFGSRLESYRSVYWYVLGVSVGGFMGGVLFYHILQAPLVITWLIINMAMGLTACWVKIRI